MRQIYFANPCAITHIAKREFRPCMLEERVSGGDWDLDVALFDDYSTIYAAYKSVFFEDMNWESTVYYTSMNEPREARCRYLTYLYKSMREFGFTQDPKGDYVSAIIGRNGEVILNNGRHRVAAAKLLGIKEICFLVDVRHMEWVEFKQDIGRYAYRHGGEVYSPLPHFDLSGVASRQGDRRGDVLSALRATSQTVVDLGAQWGQMCGFLEDTGRICVAVESDPVEYSFLKRFRDVGRYNYEIVFQDICSFIHTRPMFDCVIAMSILHHLAKTEDGHKKLIALLKEIDCNEMIFQMPDKGEMKKLLVYRDYEPDEFVKLILDNSCLNRSREIGNRESRKLFHLWK